MRKRKKDIRNFVHVSINLLTNVEKNDRLIKNRNKKDKEKRTKRYKGVNMTDGIAVKNHDKISAFDAANYIIQLYYKTGLKYRCTRSKVEKLLSIAGFVVMAKTAESLYEQDIIVNPCGTGFSNFSIFYPPEIIKGEKEESNQEINGDYSSLVQEDVSIPFMYQDFIEGLSQDVQELLFSVFKRFGDYAPEKLGKAIDKFKDKIAIVKNLRELIIDPQKTYDYFQNFVLLKDNSANNEDEINKEADDLYKYLLKTSSDAVSSLRNGKETLKLGLRKVAKKMITEEKIVQTTYEKIVQYIQGIS